MADSPASQPDGERWLQPAEAAAILCMDPHALRKYAGTVLSVRRTLGGHRRYLEAECRTLAEQLLAPAGTGGITPAVAS